MALKNVLSKGTYTTIDVAYAKKQRLIVINSTVYASAESKSIITQIHVAYSAVRQAKNIDVLIAKVNDIPSAPQKDDVVFVPKILSIDDVPQLGIMIFNGEKWNSVLYDSVFSNGKFYRLDGTTYIIDPSPDNDIWWDATFGISRIQEYDDIYAFAYNYLKSNHPAFTSAEDC